MEKILRNISEININNFAGDISVQERKYLMKIIDCAKGYIESGRDRKQMEKICIEVFNKVKTGTFSMFSLYRETDISKESYSQYGGFTDALCNLMEKMQESGHADAFIRYVETEGGTKENNISKQKSSENRKGQKTPVSFGEINRNNEDMLELIGRQNVLEGYDGNEEMTMDELIKSDLFIHVLNVGNNSVEIDGYITDLIKRMTGRSYYLAISSKLGRGKTVFISKLVNYVCRHYKKKILLIFISNNPNMQTEQNRRIWNCFLSKKFSKKRKVWIIIDGLDEIVEGNNTFVDLSHLKKAADYYGAKVIIACRDAYYNFIYKENKEILFNDRIYIYDNKEKCFEEVDKLKENIEVSRELLGKVMEIPLYATRIRIAFQTWCEADEEEKAAMRMFYNDYTFMEFLVNNTLLREKQNYGSDMSRYLKALYRIALMAKKYDGVVSVKACVDEDNGIDAELIESDLIRSFVRIKDNPADVNESVIQGFVIQNFAEYFWASGLCRALKDKDALVKEEWLADYDLSRRFDKKNFLAGWNEMAGDQKKRALRILEETAENSELKENAEIILNTVSK